jgi:hypothetical protein
MTGRISASVTNCFACSSQFAEAAVRKQNDALFTHGKSRFVHGFHNDAIETFRAGQRKDLFTLRAIDNERIHIAAPYGFQRLIGFIESQTQALNLFGQVVLRLFISVASV